MDTAKLKTEGNSQIVVLPEEYHLQGSEAYIKKVGNTIILISQENPWQALWNSLDLFDSDFMTTREQPQLDKREELFE